MRKLIINALLSAFSALTIPQAQAAEPGDWQMVATFDADPQSGAINALVIPGTYESEAKCMYTKGQLDVALTQKRTPARAYCVWVPR